jgi:hypothetical protein
MAASGVPPPDRSGRASAPTVPTQRGALAHSAIAFRVLRVGTAAALGAVLLYRYVDVGVLGPLPDMYENTWQVPGKLLSAYAEGAAVVLAGLGLMTAVLARRSAPAHRELGYGRRPGPTGWGRAPQW